MKRRAGRLLLLATAVALAGCSLVKFAYHRADRLIVASADRWLDLDRVQETRLREAARRRMAAHRADELPQYAAFLRRLHEATLRETTADDFEWLFTESRRLFEYGFERSLAPFAATLASLTPAQVEHFAGELAEANEEYAEELAAGPERREERIDDLIDDVERWTGRLHEAQRERLARLVDEVPDTALAWNAHRLARQTALLGALRDGASAAGLEALLREWWLDDAHVPVELTAQWAENRRRYATGLAELVGSLDGRQRARVRERLAELIEICEELAAEGGTSSTIDPPPGLLYEAPGP